MDKPPFDPQRAAFWLLAAVIAVECIVALMGAVSCLWFSRTVLSDPNIQCDPDNRLMQILQNALAAALALWGIRQGTKS